MVLKFDFVFEWFYNFGLGFFIYKVRLIVFIRSIVERRNEITFGMWLVYRRYMCSVYEYFFLFRV